MKGHRQIGTVLIISHMTGMQSVAVAKYAVPSDCVAYSGYSTGLHIVFKTNSKTISARWTTSDRVPGTNMTPNTQKGLDLYIMRDGEWIFAGVGSPKISGTRDTHEGTIVTNMAEGEKLCLLYLPIFDSVGKLEIGIEESSNIAATENPLSLTDMSAY